MRESPLTDSETQEVQEILLAAANEARDRLRARFPDMPIATAAVGLFPKDQPCAAASGLTVEVYRKILRLLVASWDRKH